MSNDKYDQSDIDAAYRAQADVYNLTGRVAQAESAVGSAVKSVAKAKTRLAAAETAVTAAELVAAETKDRLEAAGAALGAFPAPLLDLVNQEIERKYATRPGSIAYPSAASGAAR